MGSKYDGYHWSSDHGAWIPDSLQLNQDTVHIFVQEGEARGRQIEDAVRRILELSEELHLTIEDLEKIFEMVKGRSQISSFFLNISSKVAAPQA